MTEPGDEQDRLPGGRVSGVPPLRHAQSIRHPQSIRHAQGIGHDGVDGGGGDERADHRRFFLGRVQHEIGIPPDRHLPRAHHLGGTDLAHVLAEIGLRTHPAEMQVVTIIRDFRLGAEARQRQQHIRDIRAAQQHQIEIGAVVAQPFGELRLTRPVEHLDPHVLQRLGVAGRGMQVERPELHHAPGVQQRPHERHHGP